MELEEHGSTDGASLDMIKEAQNLLAAVSFHKKEGAVLLIY